MTLLIHENLELREKIETMEAALDRYAAAGKDTCIMHMYNAHV